MIFKPTNISPDGGAFVPFENITITWKNNGDMMYAYEVTVEDNATGIVAYTSGKVQSYKSIHVIPASSLQVGITYRFKIKVYNSVDGNATSDYKVFTTASRPLVNIPNDGIVRNQTASFIAEYSQAEGIAIKSWKFILYDVNGNVLEHTAYFYNSDLQYTFNTKLNDGEYYLVECQVIAQNDITGSSGRIQILADYTPPKLFYKIEAETTRDNPYVELSWSTVRIIGDVSGTTSFVAGESKIDVENGKVFFTEGFELDGDFTLKLWAESIDNNEEIIATLVGGNGQITIKCYGDRIHAFKQTGNVIVHIATEPITYTHTDQLFIRLQQVGKQLNIYSEVV